MIGHILLIGLGGALGSIARYLTVLAVARAIPERVPAGTFTVNVIGSFAIGVIFGLSHRYAWLSPEWRFFLATGFCGGFTTFSAFAYENMMLIESRDYSMVALNVISSVAVCLAAVFAGLMISKG